MAQIDELEPGLRRIIAPNPSPMTQAGTNTYIIGTGSVAVIDPGPDSDPHLSAILGALNKGEVVSHILVTHSHLDHSPLARGLSAATGAPILAFGPSHAGRSATMSQLAERGGLGGSEGIDADFVPDVALADGACIDGLGWSITARHTPGHLSNHMCFEWNDATFTGDHVMGWASSMVSPPDGDVGAFMTSCERLLMRQHRVFYSGHGDPIDDPTAHLHWLMDHRKGRESEIISVLAAGPSTVQSLTEKIYHDVDARLHSAAQRNILAHLIDLWEKDQITAAPTLSTAATFALR